MSFLKFISFGVIFLVSSICLCNTSLAQEQEQSGALNSEELELERNAIETAPENENVLSTSQTFKNKMEETCPKPEKAVTPNSKNIYDSWANTKALSDDAQFVEIENCYNANGVFGIEAGTVANGESSTGGVFWFIENKDYDLKIGFNIGNTANVDADFSNIGEIIRDSDEFGQFTLSFKKLAGFKSFYGASFGLLVDTSYTELDFEGEQDTRPSDGGLVALKIGTFLPSTQFELSNKLTGTAVWSIAAEHRRVIEDIANDIDDINRVFNGNDKTFSGLSTQIDLSLSNNQRYFIKFTKFNDASGIDGLDGTQVTVGVKVDGVFEQPKT